MWIAFFTVLGCAPTADVSQDAGIIKQEDLAYIACLDAGENNMSVAKEVERALKGITVFIEGDLIWCAEVFHRDATRARRILDLAFRVKGERDEGSLRAHTCRPAELPCQTVNFVQDATPLPGRGGSVRV